MNDPRQQQRQIEHLQGQIKKLQTELFQYRQELGKLNGTQTRSLTNAKFNLKATHDGLAISMTSVREGGHNTGHSRTLPWSAFMPKFIEYLAKDSDSTAAQVVAKLALPHVDTEGK